MGCGPRASGIGLAVAGIKLFIALAAGWYPPTDEIQVDDTVLGFTVGLSLVTGIVSGVAPALRSSAVNLTASLKAGAQGALKGVASPRQRRLGVAEAALALVLLVGAGLMLNSFIRLVRVDPGVDMRGRIVHEDLIGDTPPTIVGVVGDYKVSFRSDTG